MPRLIPRFGLAPVALAALACDRPTRVGQDDVDFDEPRQAGFVPTPDGGAGADFECDLYTQNCGSGEKCMPWGRAGSHWYATRCSPVAANAAAPGMPCTVEEHFASGLDDCERGSMCANVDPSTNQGLCYALPIGSAGNRRCPDAFEVVPLRTPVDACLASCNPLAPKCPPSHSCYRQQSGVRFACEPDNSGMGGAAGDECRFTTACDPGLVCLHADAWPGCTGPGCCTPVCNLGFPDCPTGTDCEPWDPPVIVPGQEDVGVCRS